MSPIEYLKICDRSINNINNVIQTYDTMHSHTEPFQLIVDDNYFSNLSSKIHENCCFYANLRNYVQKNVGSSLDQQVDNLYKMIANKIDIVDSDFDEIFIQVFEEDMSENEDAVSTKILLLLYDRLGLLEQKFPADRAYLENETIHEFLCFITNNCDDLYDYPIDKQIIIVKNNKFLEDFVLQNRFFTMFYATL
uniref:Uncharacterized protein n=1 Tax=viral metagenome TaxID=1070528 RepID=A0A6C0C941_9ZZZZ